MENENIIEVNNLWTRFGEQIVHRDLNLKVKRGEVLGLVGGSGSGKTALLRQIIGLSKPHKGQVKLFGESLFNFDPDVRRRLRQRFGMLFQQGALFSALSVFENVAFPLRELRLLPKEALYDLVILKLKLVEIEPQHAWKMPAELSGGMIKRVALARALALEPELLILDEPTAGLDPDRSERLVELVRELREELGLTVLMVTHDLSTLVALADRVAVLAEQRIIAVEGLDQVTQIDHRFIQNFFGGERGQRAFDRSGNQ